MSHGSCHVVVRKQKYFMQFGRTWRVTFSASQLICWNSGNTRRSVKSVSPSFVNVKIYSAVPLTDATLYISGDMEYKKIISTARTIGNKTKNHEIDLPETHFSLHNLMRIRNHTTPHKTLNGCLFRPHVLAPSDGQGLCVCSHQTQ